MDRIDSSDREQTRRRSKRFLACVYARVALMINRSGDAESLPARVYCASVWTASIQASETSSGAVGPWQARSPSCHPAAPWHPLDFTTRLVEAGFFNNIASGRIGLGTILPPQFGQTPFSTF